MSNNSNLFVTEAFYDKVVDDDGHSASEPKARYFRILLPPHARKPGSVFVTKLGHSRKIRIRVPESYGGGKRILVSVPPAATKERTLEVELPRNLKPGVHFVVPLERICVILRCPADFMYGQRLRFNVPFVNSKQYKFTVAPGQSDVEAGKLVKILLNDGRTAFLRQSPDWDLSTMSEVDSAQIISQQHQVKYPEGVFPERPILVQVGGQLFLTKTPKTRRDRFGLCLPFDKVFGTNLELVYVPQTIPDSNLWSTLPSPVLGQILDFLTVSEIRDWRLVDSHFGVAGKFAFTSKLKRLGVGGSSYKEVTTNALDFRGSADSVMEDINHVFDQIGTVKQGQPMNMRFIPGSLFNTFSNSVRHRFIAPDLLKLCEVTEPPFPSNGRKSSLQVGLDLAKIDMSLTVWVEQYRRELEYQQSLLRLSTGNAREKVKELLVVIRGLENAGITVTQASYIPRIPSEDTIFEYVQQLFDAPLESKYQKRLNGFADGNGILVGVDLRYTGLMLSIAKTPPSLKYKYARTISLKQIDRHIDNCWDKLMNA